jgi:hypothetical protein
MLDLHAKEVQLVFTALTASLATVAVLSAYRSYAIREKRQHLNEDILRHLSEETPRRTDGDPPDKPFVGVELGYEEDLIREQLARNYAFFGEESMRKIRGGSVVIVGCGGVGSWAAVMLVRS